MPSLFESLTSLLAKGDMFDKIAGLIDGDKKQSEKAVDSAVPALLNGLAEKAAQPGGSKAITDMLDSSDSDVLGNPKEFLSKGDPTAGNTLLDGVFGSNRDDLVSSLASKSGLSGGMFGKLLPMLAPLVLGVLGKRRKDEKLDADGVASLLASEKIELEKKGLLSSGSLKGGAGKAKDVAANAKDSANETKKAAKNTVKGGSDSIKKQAAKAGAGAAAAGAVAKGASKSASKKASAAKGEASKTVASAKKGGASVKKNVGATAGKVPDSSGSLAWLWWIIGAVLLLVGLAFLLKQCGDDSASTDDDATTTVGETSTTVETTPSTEALDAAGLALQTEVDALLPGEGDFKDTDVLGVVGADGVVTLTGTVETEELKAAAEESVAGLDGVESVVNEIVVNADAGLQTELDALLPGEGDFKDTDVKAAAKDGVVTLTGTVETEELKAAAEESVAGLDGVESVVNEIVVGTDAESSETTEAEDDAEKKSLNADLNLDKIEFNENSATLTGEGQATLDEVFTAMQDEKYVSSSFEVQGHTNNIGEPARNEALSQQRAETARTYLVDKGIDAARLTAKGYGSDQPDVPHGEAGHREANRRVVFVEK